MRENSLRRLTDCPHLGDLAEAGVVGARYPGDRPHRHRVDLAIDQKPIADMNGEDFRAW
ncbi:hypothetical protein [Saccharopolyspora phatthalungensis]|uniref:Uncharacterized protein n=1 Tax=Saccharopolyspora phatthalungensis TaxID=664693 RepID=A0A840QGT5_9PSEU|nr:hypothetical protein [Saccharopolyspora phatthalungensis]MBB5159311.1 hypothetical protein [Saccharopolyspora phatthalungensis]